MLENGGNSACAAWMDSAIRHLREMISTQAANTISRDQEVINYSYTSVAHVRDQGVNENVVLHGLNRRCAVNETKYMPVWQRCSFVLDLSSY